LKGGGGASSIFRGGEGQGEKKCLLKGGKGEEKGEKKKRWEQVKLVRCGRTVKKKFVFRSKKGAEERGITKGRGREEKKKEKPSPVVN